MFDADIVPNTTKIYSVRRSSAGTYSFPSESRYSPYSTWIVVRNQTAGTRPAVEGANETIGIRATSSVSEAQNRIRQRWPEVLARAQQLRRATPKPVESLIELLGGLPGDYATWREILEEPYG